MQDRAVTELQCRVQDRAVSGAAEHEAAMAELQGRTWAMEEQVAKQETEMWWLAKEVLEVRDEALTAAQDTTEDNTVETTAPDGPKDFEAAIAAVQCSTMQYCSIQEWRHNTYEGVWDAQTRDREEIKRTKADEATERWKQRRTKTDENMKIYEDRRR